jgi:5'-AMP-activated protein kinase catalytic alpha subunit
MSTTTTINTTTIPTSIKLLNTNTHNYTIHEQILGKGFYSKIHLGTHKKTQEKVAIKIIEKSKLITSEERSIPKRESNSLRKLKHCAHVIKLYDEAEDDLHHILILELAQCSLRDVLDKNPLGIQDEEECKRIIHEVIRAINAVHAIQSAHLDLHPSNILLNMDGKVKVADFGSSMEFQFPFGNNHAQSNSSYYSLAGEPRGTFPYSAPELTRGNLHTAADSWSVGAILYEMITGCPPVIVTNMDCNHINNNDRIVTFPDSLWGKKSVLAKNLTQALLQSDPQQRLSMEKALCHEWFSTSVL